MRGRVFVHYHKSSCSDVRLLMCFAAYARQTRGVTDSQVAKELANIKFELRRRLRKKGP